MQRLILNVRQARELQSLPSLDWPGAYGPLLEHASPGLPCTTLTGEQVRLACLALDLGYTTEQARQQLNYRGGMNAVVQVWMLDKKR